jgi:hypothetical protein
VIRVPLWWSIVTSLALALRFSPSNASEIVVEPTAGQPLVMASLRGFHWQAPKPSPIDELPWLLSVTWTAQPMGPEPAPGSPLLQPALPTSLEQISLEQASGSLSEHSSVVPLPASSWLLGSAALAMMLLSRPRSARPQVFRVSIDAYKSATGTLPGGSFHTRQVEVSRD